MKKSENQRSAIAVAQQRIAALQAIVDRLPKTRDGVPITPGMEVWTRRLYDGKLFSARVEKIVIDEDGLYLVLAGSGARVRDPDECFSTREAAEAAEVKQHPTTEGA
jgi:hypothetical protein